MALFFSAPAGAVELRLDRIAPDSYKPVKTEDVAIISDNPGYKIADAIACGFTVTLLASATVSEREPGSAVMAPFLAAITEQAAQIGANAIQVKNAREYKNSKNISEVSADLYRVSWGGTVPETLQGGFLYSARLYNTEILAALPYSKMRQAIAFKVERDVIKDKFELSLSTASGPFEQFSDIKFSDLSADQRKKISDFFKLSRQPDGDVAVNDILSKADVETLDILLGAIKAGIKEKAGKLALDNPVLYEQYKRLYLRIYESPPLEDQGQ